MKSAKVIKKHAHMVENIYDIILQTEFEKEARKELKRFIGNKNVSVDYGKGILEIGNNFTLTLNN